jgi:hypothetical protein
MIDSNSAPRYHSLWDEIHSWGSQGVTGKIKFALWVTFVIILTFILLPAILSPLFSSSEFGSIVSVLLYIAVIALIQVVGSRLKVEIKSR